MNALNRSVDTSDICGFGNVVVSSQGKRIECRLGSALGKRAEHDDGQLRIELANLNQRRQSIHLWHFHVQGDDIGIDLRNLRKGDFSVGRDARNLNGGIHSQGIRQQSTYDRRVVNDENSYLTHCGLSSNT